MTIQQEAYKLIDSLPEDKVGLIVQVMINMLPDQMTSGTSAKADAHEETSKMKAFQKMMALRKEGSRYPIPDFDSARQTAMKEKYGTYMHKEETP